MEVTGSGSDVLLKSSSRDDIIGGFTVEILPFWMSSPVKCSDELANGIPLRKFERISEKLRTNLAQMGIKRLFPVQSFVIPSILDSYEDRGRLYCCQPRDICISAPTGSGKTLAYLLPILQLLGACRSKVIRAVIVLPVRDLAKQVAETIHRLAYDTSLRVVLLTGEDSFTVEQDKLLIKNAGNLILPDIVVCTPGRLVDHIYNTPNFCLEHIRFLVIDEADRVIVEEKQDWYNIFERAVYGISNLSESKGRLKRSFPLPTIESQCSVTLFTLQKILLSATLTHDPEPLKRFRLNFPRLFLASGRPAESNVKELLQGSYTKGQCANIGCETHDKPEEKNHCLSSVREQTGDGSTGGVGVFSTPSGLKEFFVELAERQKPLFLAHLIKSLGHERILCFTNSREATKRLAVLMSHVEGVKAGALNAGMPLQKRVRLLSSFASGEFQLLVCTDAVARGIDIENVSCVVSYEAPQSVKTYVHRVGRTARAGKTGQAFTLLLRNQIRYFKSSLKSVGKRARNFPIHSSKLRAYEASYKGALSQLEKEFRTKPKDAFGIATEVDDESHTKQQESQTE
ncbi:ATP dependent RNA helicase DDX51 [Echinococcus multilocularis]|uniref:ATP-dependent RNA helicase n=1 Tax=Echinococcus multilocularis TaxID=6211 RepID=A0A068Y7R8_ECHMU|nr:ATP dependent RNA helicase DDX51 [Echinococcus multilocularis]